VKLHRGDIIHAQCAGWKGYGVVIAEENEVVTFLRANDSPGSKPCVAPRSRVNHVSDIGFLEFSLGDLWGLLHGKP